LGAGIAFCILFGISMLLHTFTSVRTRTWWQIVFAVGALSTPDLHPHPVLEVKTDIWAQLKSSAGQAELGHQTVSTKQRPF
jgi:hypothetical protein